MKQHNEQPKVSFKQALLGFFIPIAIIIFLVLNGVSAIIALFFGIMASILYGLYLGFTYDKMQEAGVEGISRLMASIIIMILVGIMIGVWIESGSVAALLVYGMKLMNPKFFLPITFVVCIITTLATGTSWGTAGTMGLALIGVAEGMGIPLGMTTGAIISGAIVGEKVSPLAGTTLLAAASTETELNKHLKSVLNTSIPAILIGIVGFTVLGLNNHPALSDLSSIDVLINGMQQHFNINPIMLIPPLVVLVLTILQKPSLPVFTAGIVVGIIWAIIFQGADLFSVLETALNGYVSNTGVASIDSLLSRGGALSMSTTVFLCTAAGFFGGILEYTTILSTLMYNVLRFIKRPGDLVLSTTVTSFILMIGGAGQYVTLSLPGIAFKEAYTEKDVDSSVLSRTMIDSGVVLGAAIPWDVSALFYSSVLAVALVDYIPYLFPVLLMPIIGVVNGYLGIGILRRDQKGGPFTLRNQKK